MWNIWESLTLHKNLQNHTVSNWCLKPSNSDRELGNYNVHFQQKGCIFKQLQWLSCITFLDPTITDNTFVFLLVKSHLLVQSHPVLWYSPVSLLSVVSKVFEKPVNSRIVDHPEKCLFCDFQFGFRSSWSTADLLTVVSDRIARAFNKSGAIGAVGLDISKSFDSVWHAGLLHKLKSCGT